MDERGNGGGLLIPEVKRHPKNEGDQAALKREGIHRCSFLLKQNLILLQISNLFLKKVLSRSVDDNHFKTHKAHFAILATCYAISSE